MITNDTQIHLNASTWKFFHKTAQWNASSNSTQPVNNSQQISVTSLVSMALTAVGLLTNGTLLLAFIKDRTIRTPFNVYLINLVLANSLSVVLVFPLSIVDMLYPVWILGDAGCIFRQYGRCIIQAMSFHAHELIAINRIWAVCHPHSYRIAHFRTRGPVVVCLGMWLIIHLLVLPWLLLGMNARALPVNGRKCFFVALAENNWDIFIQFTVYDVPILIMLSAFPIIFLVHQIRRRRSIFEQSQAVNSTSRHSGSRGATTSKSATVLVEPENVVQYRPSIPATADFVLPTIPLSNRIEPTAKIRQKRSKANFLVLGLLTISVAFCWAPSNTVYTLGMFVKIPSPAVYQIVIVFYSLQPTIDPILFVIALKNVRDSVQRMFQCKKR